MRAAKALKFVRGMRLKYFKKSLPELNIEPLTSDFKMNNDGVFEALTANGEPLDPVILQIGLF